jgi:toxin ParE1/3/4
MSALKFYIDFSVLAQKDVDDILGYTLKNWGGNQLAVYRNKINRALKTIVSNPTKSMKHTAGLYEFLVERHRIFYRVKGSTVYIVRILHHSMDTALHLKK